MKRFIFNIILIVFFAGNVFGQQKHQKKIDTYHSVWDALTPRYGKIQFAGSMGLLSFGTGWDYGQRNQWETDVFVGFLPKFSTDRAKATFTLKQNYIPWNINIKKSNFFFEPLTCAVYFNTIFGKEFWRNSPVDVYPEKDYYIGTRVRINLAIGERITFDIPDDYRFFAKSITFFYEIGSNDIALMNGFQNKYVKPHDFIKLSLGMKIQFL